MNMYKLKSFIEEHKDKLKWHMLSANPNAIHLLEQTPNKILWWNLSANPKTIHLLDTEP